jgi:fructosamine-3-kinase
MRVAGIELVDPRRLGGGDICRAFRATTTDGRPVFAKTLAEAPLGFFEAEAHGLERLHVEGGPKVAAVQAVAADGLVLDWIEPGSPTRSAALRFGGSLAALHASGGETFGAETTGFVATVRLDNSPTADWLTFQAERRIRPALRAARDRGRIDAADAASVEGVIEALAQLAGPHEAPARCHGDLWAGNVAWGADGEVWLVDAAAAHYGHRETDLAMLALFGGGYGARAGDAARRSLREGSH